MRLTWTPQAWEDYLSWQKTDTKKVQRTNQLSPDALIVVQRGSTIDT